MAIKEKLTNTRGPRDPESLAQIESRFDLPGFGGLARDAGAMNLLGHAHFYYRFLVSQDRAEEAVQSARTAFSAMDTACGTIEVKIEPKQGETQGLRLSPDGRQVVVISVSGIRPNGTGDFLSIADRLAMIGEGLKTVYEDNLHAI